MLKEGNKTVIIIYYIKIKTNIYKNRNKNKHER